MELDGCPLPEDRRYDTEGDVWVTPGPGARVVTIGVTAILASLAGKFLSVRYRDLDRSVLRGESLVTLESVRFTGPVRTPLSGRVLERNPALPERPKLDNDSPYDRGWIARIEREDDGATGGDGLLSADAVRPKLEEKIRSFRILCLPAVPDVEIIEIGSECAAVLARLDEELARMKPEEIALLVTDDATAPIEMVRWQDRSGHTVLDRRVDGAIQKFLVRREANPQPRRRSAVTGAVRPANTTPGAPAEDVTASRSATE
jgi:glycine cleavage system H protein